MDLARRITRWGAWVSHLGLLPADAARDAAAGIEQLGYGCLWIGEAEGKEALTHAGLLLAATRRAVIATGIANIWARDAMAMANGARTLAEAYPARFVLGLGASHPALLETRGQRYDRPLTAMREYLDAMDGAPWRGPRLPDEPPRVLAALRPRMLELAAARSAGVHTFLVTPDHTRRARERVGPGSLVAPEQAVVLAERRGDARSAADRHLAGYLALPNYRRNLEWLGWDLAAHADGSVSDELFDALIAWGDAATVAERLALHHEAGADHVAVHPLVPSVDDGPVPTLRELAPHLSLA